MLPPVAVYDPAEETYLDVQRTIYRTAESFRRRYGGDMQESLSEANEHFMAAYRSYSPDKQAEFRTWTRFVVWHGLLETARREARRRRKLRREMLNMERIPARESFRLSALLNEVSEDAAIILRLLIGCPDRLPRRKRRLRISAKRNVLFGFLADIGWAAERIQKACEEIREALR